MKVLVVDDDSLICENIKSKLSRIVGYDQLECRTANSVVDAKLAIKLDAPEVLITDLNMPGISGLTLVKYVKNDYPSVKIYVLSGYDDYHLVREAFLSGAEDYLLKPLEIEELKQKIVQDEFVTQERTAEKTDSYELESALQYIERNIFRNLTMNEVADSIAMSYNYFSRRFKEYTGYRFPEYINIRRLECSKDYLKDPSLKISEIAYKVGYNSASTFSKAFKKYEGCYPVEYRKKQCISENI